MKSRLEKVAAYATALANKYLSARQKLAIMEPLLAEDMAKLFDDSYGAHAYQALRLTLMLDLLRDIWAFTLDTNESAPSLRNVWRLIEHEELRSALRDSAAKPSAARGTFSEGWSQEDKERWQARWDTEDINRGGDSFDEAFKRVAAKLPEIVGSEISGKVDKARKKVIAHYDMKATTNGPKLSSLAEFGLKWGDPKAFLENLDPVVWDVVLLATWGSYDVEGFDKAHRLYAADFWARLQGKSPIDHLE